MSRSPLNRQQAQDESAAFDWPLNGRVLIVDDDAVTRSIHRSILAGNFDVLTAASGEEAIRLCTAQAPDLVILDVGLPGIDGYETCRRLRQLIKAPIIFVTGHHTLEDQLKAFDAGGNDLIPKPVTATIFSRKAAMAIRQYRMAATLAQEKQALERMAMGFLSSASQTGILLEFMRKSVISPDYPALAENLLTSIQDLGLESYILIRHSDGGSTVVTARGSPSPLEESILENVKVMGRLFQFKQRLVVNYDRVSIIVSNMPDEGEEPERTGILRDSLAILAESTEAMAVNVDLRLEGQKRAEQLQIALSEAELAVNSMGDQNRLTLCDTRLLLQEMVDGIENTYSWLDTSHAQELAISATMDESVQRILGRLSNGTNFDARFLQVMQAFKAGSSHDAVELF
ncbi:response regulator [Zoogloea sp.]|uniref:response regulator n=1 Tax=Zoogloea sp. TaxID=49181 RepID=UPI0031FC5189